MHRLMGSQGILKETKIRIYFSGFFIRNHAITMNTISYAVNYWSRGTMEALFLKHEGYLGAIGAFLHQPCASTPQT